MKAYSYIRFSTPEQAQGDSLRRQTSLAAAYVKQHGLTLDTELSMKDLGVSGFRGDNRAVGALGAFLKAINDGLVEQGSVLLVESLDRISRQVARVAVRTLEDIVLAGVDVITLNDGKRYNPDSLNGIDFLMAILLFMRGNEESSTKSKRNAASWAAKRAALGKTVATSQVPAWIDVTGSATKDAGHNAKLSLNKERAKIVKRIFVEYTKGAGIGGIAKGLTADGIKTWGSSAEWHPKYIYRILRLRAVIGEFIPCIAGKPQAAVPGYFPRAIDDDLFEAAQSLMETRQGHAPRTKLIQNILSQLAVCPKCGSSMRRKNPGSKVHGRIKLVCSRADHGGACDYVTVDLGEIETALQRWDCKIPRADASIDDAIKNAEATQIGLETELDRLADFAPSKTIDKRIAQCEAQLERNAAELGELIKRAGESDSRVLKRRTAQLKEALSAKPLDRAAVNVTLRTLLSKVAVEYQTGELVLYWKHDGFTRLEYGDMAAREFINFTKVRA